MRDERREGRMPHLPGKKFPVGVWNLSVGAKVAVQGLECDWGFLEATFNRFQLVPLASVQRVPICEGFVLGGLGLHLPGQGPPLRRVLPVEVALLS